MKMASQLKGKKSATGDSVLVCGIGSTQLNVPLHCVNLESDLVWGEVVVGVLSVLPVEGVDVILGNDLAGDHVTDTEENYDDAVTLDWIQVGENILAPKSPPAPSGMDYDDVGEEPLERGGAF
ncbi:hypothetical protein SKAU_G00276000 [Synaphobranchus kaupii]|uniref:Uncharacterized protein n=1 Tax=Synaphobranchus kaupii TaxID=118154 RepID=A0A9Q1F191_SYNKA|nr:hypothetical protein SKAU_G00276000 [Synaphobranchus kaupii]